MLRSRPAFLLLLAAAACADSSVAPLAASTEIASFAGAPHRRFRVVTTSADAGAGSLRAAVEDANADPSIGLILISSGAGEIAPLSPIVYTGEQAIRFDGGGRVIDASAVVGNGLTFAAHRAVTVRNLTVKGASDVGIAVLVPTAASGTVVVSLDNVTVTGNGGHGVLINDQTAYLSDPDATASEGSAATLDVRLRDLRSIENEFGTIDRDGVRINEGGEGELRVDMRSLTIVANGGDGIELDERGNGSADFRIAHSSLLRNGAFSAEDYDDGIDVDELDAGDLRGRFTSVVASGNFEQGVDLNENHAGNLVVTMVDVTAADNLEEGIEFEEDDDFAGGGDIVAALNRIIANGNGANDGDAGLKVREKGDGDVDVTMSGVEANENAIGGVLVREDAGGNLVAALRHITADGNTGHGVQFDENSNGTLDARLLASAANGNSRAGVQAEQATSGSGTLLLAGFVASANVEGAVVANAAQVVVTLVP